MDTGLVVALAVGIGFVAGLRSMTAPAAVSWAARLGWLDLQGSPLAFMGSTVAVAVFSLLTIGEFVADLLPSTPNRTAPSPLVARAVSGGLSGACLFASANRSLTLGALLGALGGVIGAFAGYEARARVVAALRMKDRVIALSEDLVAVVLGWLIVSCR
ncbi:MAG: DUF4126 family protein [Gemmatimonadales bacterium]|nr:DUF4126 family protein [Gemmatimonadales bacterium]